MMIQREGIDQIDMNRVKYVWKTDIKTELSEWVTERERERERERENISEWKWTWTDILDMKRKEESTINTSGIVYHLSTRHEKQIVWFL